MQAELTTDTDVQARLRGNLQLLISPRFTHYGPIVRIVWSGLSLLVCAVRSARTLARVPSQESACGLVCVDSQYLYASIDTDIALPRDEESARAPVYFVPRR